MMQKRVMLAAWLLLALAPCAPADEPPMIPVGLDAYRMWDRWPYQRIGARAYMRSTYDRRGGNEGADASHFLYQQADDFNVSLDVEGPGVLYFVRTNHWHGSPWHYELDGVDHIVRETSTADPNHPATNSVFLPERLFPNPLTWTWSITKGADLMWVPIAFEKTFRLAYSRTRYGTGYYIYHQYVPGANLSRPIRAWDGATPPDPAVLDLIGRAGTDIAPPQSELVEIKKGSFGWLNETRRPKIIRKLGFSVPRDQAVELGRCRLRITWDGRAQPSVDAPIALFFGAGTLYNRDGREYLVKGFPMSIRFEGDRVHLACYYPMPYFNSAFIELVGPNDDDFRDIEWSVRTEPYTGPRNHVGYFHATYRDIPTPERGKDLVLLDTRAAEGGGDWTGSFVGMSWIFSHDAVLNTLEGDPRFFFDDSLTPQACGTGTEEWGGGGDYWGGRNMTLPFAGHPCGARNAKEAKGDEDLIQSAYRFLLADLMPFGRNAVIRLEHGGTNESTEHYESVVYWYGLPGASLVLTDELDVGDPASEQAHAYVSPDASATTEILSRHEYGVDTLPARKAPDGTTIPVLVVYPPHTETERHTKSASEFTLKLEPNNLGVLLRRTLDYSFPHQRAEVFVADASQANAEPQWEKAGVWYLAGSNTCVYSNPREELGATQHNAQTSNRRFRDDEFLVARRLTEGRTSVRVRVRCTPVERPLFPGHPIPELAWSEIRYQAYCFVMPR